MKESLKRNVWFHVGVIFGICFLLYVLFFAALHWLTRHGEEITIPDVRGKDVNTAITTLKGMHFDIYVDSTYEPAVKPLAVLKQVPDSGSIVKQGRTVFLTVNMLIPPRIPMPNLVNLSYRSAELMLKNNKLFVGDTTYVPDIAGGAIKEQSVKGKAIRPGDMIPQGSKVDLVIGNGQGNTEFDVPDVTNMTVDDAMTILNQYGLQITLVAQGEIADTPSAQIIDQKPRAKNDAGGMNRIKEGQFIDLAIKQNAAP